ncbi:CACTA en-spm transposon protein [Cucumis melo var. makuwa]|uniref:CACTA en-spm transposon protein n=1 Tax=Cucumis melo var. makuwa TaxID=1194695 RepID=A0A5D3CCH5_CUCMM|nr:CACTA en-spm transposon protein [Cucumis melo var. makuwa]TYK09002.1 CACTA en-spm transposon protein [Cucumis melo var. makuwa]
MFELKFEGRVSRLLELERHVAVNGRIPMTIAPGVEKPISPHAVRFSQAIGMCVRKTFPVYCLKNYQTLASEIEEMQKLIQDKTRAQQRPPHDP